MSNVKYFKKITEKDIADMAKIANLITKEQLVYTISEKTTLYLGRQEFAAERIKGTRQGFSIVRLGHAGGVIVSSPGDVELGIFLQKNSKEIIELLIKQISNKIESVGYKLVKDGNDYLIDGKKCIGISTRIIGNLTVIVAHISINTDISLIKSICTKEMKKIPGALSEYGITTEDIVQILEDFSFEEDSLN